MNIIIFNKKKLNLNRIIFFTKLEYKNKIFYLNYLKSFNATNSRKRKRILTVKCSFSDRRKATMDITYSLKWTYILFQ